MRDVSIRHIEERIQPALRVVIAVAAAKDDGLGLVGQMLDAAFGHSRESSGYLTTVGTIDQIEYQRFEEPPADLDVERAWHTLVLALVDRDVSESWSRWFDAIVRQVQESGGRHKVIAFVADEATQNELASRKCGLTSVQLNLITRFGEKALRPAVLGLIAINESRRVLAKACDPVLGSHLKLFISHAKADGLPLALTIKNQIPTIPHIDKFYDDSELLLSDDWASDLEGNIAQSTVLIIRTDRFDDRSACRDEAHWADRYACPVLVVDARQALVLEESRLPIGDLPTVKLPDGNVYRALHAALWVGLRGLCVARSACYLQETGALEGARVRVLHRSPTFGAIRRICNELGADDSGGQAILVYPGPDLEGEIGEPFQVFAEKHLPGVRLATVEQLLLEAAVQL